MEHATIKAVPKKRIAHIASPCVGWHRHVPAAPGRVYSPGGCGCALLLASVVALSIGITVALLGMAALAVVGLIVAVVLTVCEIRRVRAGSGVRGWLVVLTAALYLMSVPYLVFFIWFFDF